MKTRTWFILAAAAGVGVAGALRSRNGGSRDGETQRGSLPPAETAGPRVVVLGGGFAGISAVRELRHRLGAGARITLVDRHNYHLFTPMLYEVAVWGLDPYDTAFPLREFTPRLGVTFRRGMVTGVDFAARRVALDDGVLDYDYLVIALGTATNFFGNGGAERYSYPIKWLEDGISISNKIIDRLEQATVEPDPQKRQALLTFVIVGGGATGTESAAALRDMLSHVLGRDYPNIDPHEARVIVLEMLDRLLGNMEPRMGDIALRELRNMGVEVWLGQKAKDVSPDNITLEDGRVIPTCTVLWTTGVRAPDVVGQFDLPHGKGGSIAVDQYLQVPGRPGVYAVGDNAHFEDPDSHQAAPLLAQAAIQEGKAAARNIALQIQGQPQELFHYRSLGDALSLGRWHGIIAERGLVIDGLVGWAGWRLIHLVRITSMRDKLATLLDWSMGYFYSLTTTRFDVRPSMPDTTEAVQTA
jgi:NADH dehydrogenase